MGEIGDDAPTGVAPTELAGAIDETAAHTAWSLDDGAEWQPPRRLTPRRITALALAGSLVLVAVAGVVAFLYLRDRDEPAPGGVTTRTSTVTAMPPVPATMPQAPSRGPASSQPPAPLALPTHGGSVYVKTRSGKTVCQVTAGDVACNVGFIRQTPILNGLPASGVSVTARGSWQWLVGDPGNPDYEMLGYGTVYRALGWTITPTSEGTTFINDATGHGMTVSVEGFTPF